MLDMYWAAAHECDEIVEFCDYVFSKAHRPHDFKTLLPKLYGDKGNGAAHHFIIRKDGRIVGTVLCYPMEMHMSGQRMTVIGVGSVSTHPSLRNSGLMRPLMKAIDERAGEIGADFAVLSGLRQRYANFGYVYGGYQMNAKLTAHNVKHALRDVDAEAWEIAPMGQMHVQQAKALHEKQPCWCMRGEEGYLDILRSWNNEPFVLYKEGVFAGYGTLRQNRDSCHIAELELEDEADFSAAMKAIFLQYGMLTICAAPWQRTRAAWLSQVCQEFSIVPNHFYKIYRPEHVRSSCEALGCGVGDFSFQGFALPFPLFMGPPDCV